MNNPQTSAAKDGEAQNQTTEQQSQKDDWQDHIAKLLEYSKQLKDDWFGFVVGRISRCCWIRCI